MIRKQENTGAAIAEVVCVVLYTIVLFIIAYMCGYNASTAFFMRECVDRGVAEHKVIDNLGNTEFKWLVDKPTKEKNDN